MSIPAQGRRSVLFPPPGVKIRRTIETQFLPGTPTLIAGRDPKRVLLYVILDFSSNMVAAFAGNLAGLSTPSTVSGSYVGAPPFYGPEEVWAQCIFSSPSGGAPILIQSVFYD